MCENKKECPSARMLRVPQSTRWDSDLVERMFADLPFKPCDTSLQSSNRVDDFLKRTVNVVEENPDRIGLTLLNGFIPNLRKQNNQNQPNHSAQPDEARTLRLHCCNRVGGYLDSPSEITSLPGKRPLSGKFNQLNRCLALGKVPGSCRQAKGGI